MTALSGNTLRVALIASAVVTLVRLLLLPLYDTALGPDEAQYWYWSRDLAFGYYSKPPGIGWLIALTTASHDAAWTVRLSSPVLIGVAGLFLFGAARRLYGPVPALWTLLLWHVTPAVMLGATILTTDVPLLACWSAALYALVRLTEPDARRWPWALALGAAFGLGMLSKYAMIYLVPGVLLALVLSARMRLAGAVPLLAALALGLVIFSPNLIWNLANGMQTVGHTADNAGWSGGLHADELTEFLTDQLGVLGPLLFPALLVALAVTFRRRLPEDVLLASLVVPPLLAICAQALLSRAHANWAMTAYPAALVLLPALAVRWRARWLLLGSAGLHASVGILVTTVLLHLPLADGLGMANAVKRLRGWDETAAGVASAARAGGHEALMLDDRELTAHLVWELRDTGLPIRVLDPDGRLDNTYEHALPPVPGEFASYLLVTQNDVRVIPAYDTLPDILPVGEVFVDLNATRHGRPERTLDLYAVTYPAAVAP